MITASLLENYLDFVKKHESQLPQDKVLRRCVSFKEVYRSKLFGIRRTRPRLAADLQTWDLFDSAGNELGYCYVSGQGIAGKISEYETFGQIYNVDDPTGELGSAEPIKIDLLFLLITDTIPPNEQSVIYNALRRLISP